jgi:hypothetical protein
MSLLVQTVVLDPASWTAVTPPFACDSVLISNLAGAAVLRLRTIATDPTTELTIDANTERMIAAPFTLRGSSDASRFRDGQVAFSLKPDAGTGPAKVLWT